MSADAFHLIGTHGFVRVAACVPPVRVADPAHNAEQTVRLAEHAAAAGAAVAVFPELGLTAYSNDDLFQQDALLDAALDALREVVAASQALPTVLLVGLPLRAEGRLFNVAAVVAGGQVHGVVPKSYLPNYREYHEKRQFAAARDALHPEVTLLGRRVPFGADLLFELPGVADAVLGVELCEDLWSPLPPSTFAALAGATLVANLSASNATVAKADYRRQLVTMQSASLVAAYLYSNAGPGESTTDLAWDGHALVAENGELLAESPRFPREAQVLTADVDVERLTHERRRLTSFGDTATDHAARLRAFRRVAVAVAPAAARAPLRRAVPRFPYVPADPAVRDARCREVYEIQVQGLATRLQATGIRKVVVGVSGGLDSTQALIVCCKAMDRLGLPRRHVLAYTMPGFGTSARTLAQARRLMEALGVTARELDIRPAAMQMLRDIGHPAGEGAEVHDVTYENVQAGERTSHLFRLANLHDALVVGTGDLSELALGWCTYGVGDQMSHYGVNASVPKTLIQYLIRWSVVAGEVQGDAVPVLRQVVETEISPELVPGGTAQRTEDVVGPFDLQDFHLYQVTRYGFRPAKVAFLALQAWGDASRGAWPDLVPAAQRRAYDLPAIRHWLEVFLRRFVGQSQFKRTALPNGPKVGTGGNLSPRGDWRAPSDATAAAWLDALRRGVPGG